MKKIARAEKNKNNGLLPISASLSRQRLWAPCRDSATRTIVPACGDRVPGVHDTGQCPRLGGPGRAHDRGPCNR